VRTGKNFEQHFSKIKEPDSKDQDDFAFYEISMEVEYLDEHFDPIYFDRLLFHDHFFDSDKVGETPTGEGNYQLMKRLLHHFNSNIDRIYFWFSLKLSEDQLLT